MRTCEICDAELPPAGRGRPRRYCSERCKRTAAVWAGVERVIERAREAGDTDFAAERAAWLARQRGDARHGFAGARARVDEINRRIREYR